MAQNRNRAQTKCHTSLFAFHISHLKIVSIDSELNSLLWKNSAKGKQTHFSKKIVCGTQKSSQTWKRSLNFLKKTSFDSKIRKTSKWWDKTVCIFKTPEIVAPAQAKLDFDSDPITFDHALIFTKKLSKSAKCNPIFHWKGKELRGWC